MHENLDDIIIMYFKRILHNITAIKTTSHKNIDIKGNADGTFISVL